MIGWLTGLLTSKATKVVAEKLAGAFVDLRNAENEEQRIKAQAQIAAWQEQSKIIQAEQGSYLTSWIRPVFALITAIYWSKVVVWDTVLGWGTTPYPGESVMWFVTLVPTAYFIVRPFEKRK